ncbi:MAG: class I SAM-dependent methyltransferase [Actinomycetota bacterium]|nr:class I SAM-dependent methyltransferase [Actinomycetota bacterium]
MSSTPPEIAELQSLVSRFAHAAAPVRVLEAGCGSLPMALDLGERAHLVGIDVSADQLRRNTVVDEKILGDLQTHRFAGPDFDLVFCWDVLEHLPRPDLALETMRTATRPGGLMVLKLPNVLSAKGLVTKFTPHRFHVWVYRRLLGYPNAGREGFTPFRTFLRWSIAPHRLVAWAARHDMAVEHLATYEASRQAALRSRLHLTGRPWRALTGAPRRLSRGRLDLEGTELILVLRNGDRRDRIGS